MVGRLVGVSVGNGSGVDVGGHVAAIVEVGDNVSVEVGDGGIVVDVDDGGIVLVGSTTASIVCASVCASVARVGRCPAPERKSGKAADATSAASLGVAAIAVLTGLSSWGGGASATG